MPVFGAATARGPGETLRARRFLGGRLKWQADLEPGLLQRLWGDPYALLASGERLHAKLNCTVVRVTAGTETLVLKHQDAGKLRRRVRKALSPSEASRSWVWGQEMLRLGIPTPRPRALLERRCGPLLASSFLLVEHVAGENLYRLLRRGALSERQLREVAVQIAVIWGKLESARICHNDFKPENFIVDEEDRVWLIDFDRMRHEPEQAQRRQRQLSDLRDLLHPRSWGCHGAAADGFRQALAGEPALRALCEESPAARALLHTRLEETRCHGARLTALIPCHSAEDEDALLECIDSVRDIADEILVVAASESSTERMRRAGGCRLVAFPHGDSAGFAEWIQQQVTSPWVLLLDPQERLNPELGRQVQDTLAGEEPRNGYLVSSAVRFRGRRLEFGAFPRATSLRLVRSQAARFAWSDDKLELSLSEGEPGRLKSCLMHEWDSYAGATGREEMSRGGNLRAAGRFFYSYVLRGGWLDGRLGLAACRQAAWPPRRDQSPAEPENMDEMQHPLGQGGVPAPLGKLGSHTEIEQGACR